MTMTPKQKIFVNEYLQTWNATEAARRAGYSERSIRSIAAENLTKPDIQAEIKRRIEETAMSADEILLRLAEQARGSLGDFSEITTLDDLANHPQARLVRKIKSRVSEKNGGKLTYSFDIELYDAQAALTTLARINGLLVNEHRINVMVERELDAALDALQRELDDETYQTIINTLAAQTGS